MNERLKNIFKNKYFKIVVLILLGLFIVWQSYAVYIDMYNFRQLEKVKIVLKDLKREDEQFLYLKDFNKIYNQKIEPIKNCYYLRNYNSEDRVPYTFGFKLESYIYIYIYKTKYLVYPKYDLPYGHWCEAGIGCYDKSKETFERIISNPCKE